MPIPPAVKTWEPAQHSFMAQVSQLSDLKKDPLPPTQPCILIPRFHRPWPSRIEKEEEKDLLKNAPKSTQFFGKPPVPRTLIPSTLERPNQLHLLPQKPVFEDDDARLLYNLYRTQKDNVFERQKKRNMKKETQRQDLLNRSFYSSPYNQQPLQFHQNRPSSYLDS